MLSIERHQTATGPLALGACKFRDGVFVIPPDEIKFGLVTRQFEVGEQIDEASAHGAGDGSFTKTYAGRL